MNILVLGGTRFFGVHMVRALLNNHHQVTIATRGNVKDDYGDQVKRILVDRTNASAMKEALSGTYYDVICDNIAYCSNDVKYLMEVVNCERYIMTSTVSVYENFSMDTLEQDFDPLSYPLKWCYKEDYTYDEIKRQAECALFQVYSKISGVAVRFPYVIGEDDYTKRLYFYVEHIIKGIPIYVDNLEERLSFISASEAGGFLAWLAVQESTGIFNGGNNGTVSLREIMDYIESQTGFKPIFSEDGEAGPYNGAPSFALNTSKAKECGFHFSPLKSWFYKLLDHYIESLLH